MALIRIPCPAGNACQYTTDKMEIEAAMVLIRSHVDTAHAAVRYGYIGEEVEFDTALELVKGQEHGAEAMEDVNDEFMYMGLFGYTLEDARKRQHQQFKQGSVARTKLK